MAKGFVIGIQFETLFQDNLFFELGDPANKVAEQIANILKEHGYSFYTPPRTNQLFLIIPNDILDKLSEEFVYSVQEKIDKDHSVV